MTHQWYYTGANNFSRRQRSQNLLERVKRQQKRRVLFLSCSRLQKDHPEKATMKKSARREFFSFDDKKVKIENYHYFHFIFWALFDEKWCWKFIQHSKKLLKKVQNYEITKLRDFSWLNCQNLTVIVSFRTLCSVLTPFLFIFTIFFLYFSEFIYILKMRNNDNQQKRSVLFLEVYLNEFPWLFSLLKRCISS